MEKEEGEGEEERGRRTEKGERRKRERREEQRVGEEKNFEIFSRIFTGGMYERGMWSIFFKGSTKGLRSIC